MQKLLSQGAEARIYEQINEQGRTIVKDRFRKTYRHEALDKQLRQSRARREAKVLEKLKALNFLVPKVIELDDTNSKLLLEKINGRLVKEVISINEKDKKLIARLCRKIGENIAFLHLHDIIHSDLTTSNMILANNCKNNTNDCIYFIDFGLSYFSAKIEDKAVDLHLIERALESKHYKIFRQCFDAVVDGYLKAYSDADKKTIGEQILARFEQVKERGRNKAKNVGS